MILLGIESSCDETAAALVKDGAVKANAIYSQIAKHAPYGGVVPEIASRDHVKKLGLKRGGVTKPTAQIPLYMPSWS